MDPAAIERLIEQGRDSYEARLAAGQARLKRGDAAQAAVHLEQACEMAADKTMAWQALGQACQALDDLPAAARAWQRGIEVARANGDQQAEKVMAVWLKRLDRSLLGIDPTAVFAAGRLIGLPTETVYGLAAPIDRADLVARVFELKGRPPDHPLIVHVGSLDQARACAAAWPDAAERLAQAFWPGPLTLVLEKSAAVSDRVSAGQSTVALRMPDHPLALAVLRASPAPLVAPSANRFTRLSPTRAEDVRAAFRPEQVEVIDGGPCQVGIESTIVALDAKHRRASILRPGMLSADRLAAFLPAGWHLEQDGSEHQRAPGQMREHYRPEKPLTVEVLTDAERLAARQQTLSADPGLAVVVLPEEADDAARQLYRRLRQADRGAVRAIHLLLPASRLDHPDWSGIVNRLGKAASNWIDRSRP